MQITKHTLAALIGLASTLSFQSPAQSTNNQPPANPAGNRFAQWRERMQDTARELNLTDEQKEKLQTVFREQMEKLRGLREDSSVGPQEKMEKLKSMREAIQAEAKKILTPEQLQKWQEKQRSVADPGQGPLGRMQGVRKDLNLTEEQKEKLKPIYQEQLEQLRALRENHGLSPQEKLEKFKALRNAIAPKVKEVLSAEQYEKWEKGPDQMLESLRKRSVVGKQD